jgi:hypothetical protein
MLSTFMEWVRGAEHKSSAWVTQFQAGKEDVTEKKMLSKLKNVGKVTKMMKNN